MKETTRGSYQPRTAAQTHKQRPSFMTKIWVLCFLLLILHGARHVECRRHRERRKEYTLFVFGDSFVDAGNIAKSGRSRASRGWYYPYGSSDSSHGNQATGRLSDGLVQSDFLAQILGLDESPPVFSILSRPTRHEVESGVNFAMPYSGVMNGQQEQLSLREQISQFGEFVDRGSVDDKQLENSVALLSVSNGHDYSHVSDGTSQGQLDAYVDQVTDGIIEGVKRLQAMGVSKVLVNSMPPLGCAPWRARQFVDYAQCEGAGNTLATNHNSVLRHKLDGLQDVLYLDLYKAFNSLARSMSGSTPCCDTSVHHGYCGQIDGNGRAQYTVCASPDTFFYWDNENPTQAGWEAVMMDRLQPNIKDFLAA